MTKDDRKTVNMVEVKPHVFQWIVADANEVGERISKHIGDILEIMYHMGNAGKKNVTEIAQKHSPETAAIVAYQTAIREQYLRSTVRHMAALYVEKPSEDAADRLQEACDAIKIDYDEVITLARSDPFSSIIASTIGNDKIDRCTIWLLDFIKQRGKVKSGDLMQAASSAGFNERMIHRIKRNLLENPETPYIDVDRIGNTWWYIIKDTDGNEIEATHPEVIFAPEESSYPEMIKTFLDTGEPVTIIFGNSEMANSPTESINIFRK